MSKLFLGNQEIKPSVFNCYGIKKIFGTSIDYVNEVIDLSGIEVIGTKALRYSYCNNQNIASVDFSTVKKIIGQYGCDNAFYSNTNLTSVDLSSLEIIDGAYSCYQMFQNCTSLETIDLSNLQSITGSNACQYMFQNCTSLIDVDLSNLTFVTPSSTNNTGITGINYAFTSMFQNCTSLKSVDMRHLTYINGAYDFAGMFSGCTSLTDVNLDGLVCIDGNGSSFRDCTSLKTITFTALSKVKYYPFDAMFSGCTSLTDVYFPSFGANTLSNTRFNTLLSGCLNVNLHLPTTYNPDNPHKVFDITLVNGYPNFGGTNTNLLYDQEPALIDLDFSHVSPEVMEVFVGSNVSYGNSMFNYCFQNCTNIKSVDLSTLEVISTRIWNMFAGCTNLKTVNLHNLREMTSDGGWYMFNDCTSLESVDLHNLTKIDIYYMNGMFGNCTSLRNVDLSNVEIIKSDVGSSGNRMFARCTSLKTITFDKLSTISTSCSYMFENCTSLESIYFPSLKTLSSTNVFNYFLDGCSNVTIHLPSNFSYNIWAGGTNTVILKDLPATE